MHCFDDRMEDLGQEVTVSPLPTPQEAAVAAQSIVPGGCAAPAMAMLFGTPAGREANGYRASLVARVHLRLGMWRWSISEANKARTQPEMTVLVTYCTTACSDFEDETLKLQWQVCICCLHLFSWAIWYVIVLLHCMPCR